MKVIITTIITFFICGLVAVNAQKSTLYLLYIDNCSTSDGFSLQSSQIDSIEACLRACRDSRGQVVVFLRNNDKSLVDTGLVRAQEFVNAFREGRRGRKFDSWRELELIRPRMLSCIQKLMPSAIEMNFFLVAGSYEQDIESNLHPLVHVLPLEWQELWNVPTRVNLHVVKGKADRKGLNAPVKFFPDQADVHLVFHNSAN